MFKRIFWLSVGIAFGFGCSYWLMRSVRGVAERYAPARLGGDLASAVRAVGADLREAAHEMRVGMAEAEDEIRRSIAPGSRPEGTP